MIKQDTNDPIIIMKSRKSIYFSLIVFGILLIIIWVLAALGYYKFGISTGVITIIITILYGFVVLGFFSDVPKSLKLLDNRVIYSAFLFNKTMTVCYSDIQEMEFSAYSSGRGTIPNYYLVAKCKQGVICKISLKGLITSPKDQAEIIQFILRKNPQIKFPYKLSHYDDWVSVKL